MVLSLSTFLRTTLALDPLHDIPPADEIALQEEYLCITIENDMPGEHATMRRPEGAGVGLKNVEERLRARFGGRLRDAGRASRGQPLQGVAETALADGMTNERRA